MRLLVTGAAGFIGSHAAQALIERGYRVIGVDNFCDFYDRSWKEANLKCVGRGLEVEELDITSAKMRTRAARPIIDISPAT